MTTSSTCPHCGRLLILPIGNQHSKIAMVGEFPGEIEKRLRQPFAFDYRRERKFTGDLLNEEMLRLGVSLIGEIHLTNLWMHEPVVLKKKDEKEGKTGCKLEWHLDQLGQFLSGKTHVLLMGSAVTMALVQQSSDMLWGTQVSVPGFPSTHFWVSPNPSHAFVQPIGELRLALSRFVNDFRNASKSTTTRRK